MICLTSDSTPKERSVPSITMARRSSSWAASAWAVVYGVARDVCGYKGTVSDFERNASRLKMPANFDYPCTCNKVNRTICDHAYMRLHVNKWKEFGASDRELALLEFLMARIEK